MDNFQIKNILSRDKFTRKYFLDVYASDQLPEWIEHYPACFICNVDSSAKPGSHWLAFYLPSKNHVEFFDSYGNHPHFFQGPISDFVSRYPRIEYNPLMLQSNVTTVCGQYCIYYLYSRCRGKSLQNILSHFVTKNLCNDQRVYNFVAKRFHVMTHFYQ